MTVDFHRRRTWRARQTSVNDPFIPPLDLHPSVTVPSQNSPHAALSAHPRRNSFVTYQVTNRFATLRAIGGKLDFQGDRIREGFKRHELRP
jgi:hypothetical protein